MIRSAEPGARPAWMTAAALFCLGSAGVLVWRDLFLPEVRAVEVWFGLEVRGWLALATAPLHWAIFLIGALGFWRQSRWVLPYAASYELYIAASHLVWNLVSPHGWGWRAALAQTILFAIPGLLLLEAHRRRSQRA